MWSLLLICKVNFLSTTDVSHVHARAHIFPSVDGYICAEKPETRLPFCDVYVNIFDALTKREFLHTRAKLM